MLVSPGGELLHNSCALVFCGCCLGHTPWSPGSGGQWSLHFCVPWVYNREGERVLGQPPPQGHSTGSRLKHNPSFCERGLFTCPGALAWRAGLWFHTYLRMVDAIIVLSLWPTTGHEHLLERSMYTHLEPQFLQLPHKWHLYVTQLWWSVELMHSVPQNYIYWHTLKAVAWGSSCQLTWI